MAQDLGGKVYILSRETYDAKVDQSEINSGSIYLVSETTEENPQILSMYLGLAKQTDILDITPIANTWETPIDFTNLSDNYNIPNAYQIPNKLFFYKQDAVIDTSGETDIVLSDEQYRLIAWHEAVDENDTSRFLDCGIPQTTVICPNGLPTTGQGVKNNVYIVTKPGEKSLHIFDGTNYIEVLAGGTLIPDNLTILVNPSTNEIHGVGADISGNSYEYSGTTYIAGNGASIYNDYSNNFCTGECDNVFGKSNKAVTGKYDTVFGTSNTLVAGSGQSNTIMGSSNSATGANIQNTFISGYNISLTGSGNITENAVFGRNHSIISHGANVPILANLIYGYSVTKTPSAQSESDEKIRYSFIGGKDITLTRSKADGCTVSGLNMSLNLLGDGMSVFGDGHSITGLCPSILCSGYQHNLTFTSTTTGGSVLGYKNTVSTSASAHGWIVCGNGLSVSIVNDGCAVFGAYNDTLKNNTIFAVGNGYLVGSVATRSNALELSKTGILSLEGSDGNAITVNGERIESHRETIALQVGSDTSYTFNELPLNGCDTVITNGNDAITEITITDISDMRFDTDGTYSALSVKQTSAEYNAVITFKKASSLTSVSDVLTNFTTSGSEKIYLLNPSIDISSYTVIHVLLFNDGFNICAIVSGYEEVTNP